MSSLLRLSARLSGSFPANVRTYAIHKRHFPRPTSKRPERPPPKIKDPLSSPSAVHVSVGSNLTFIHRPPPTAPSPFSLTTAPASPLLRPAKPLSTEVTDESQPATNTPLLPPPLWRKRPSKEPKRILEASQIEEMKALRAKNPEVWTQKKLAERFGCSMAFVTIAAPLSKQVRRLALAKRDQEHEAIRKRWGERKATVMAIRQKRRSLW